MPGLGFRSGPLGHAADIDRTRSAVAARAAGDGGLVLVQGPAGIGKTTVLRAVLDSGVADGATLLHATCHESSATSPYGVVRQVVQQLGLPGTCGSALLRPGQRWTSHAVAAIAETEETAETGADSTDDPCHHHTVLRGLHQLVVNAMACGPLVLVVDDLQWCDERSLCWLDYLLRRAAGTPLVVLAALRTPAAVADALADHLCADYSSVVTLRPMDLTGVRELIASGTGLPPQEAFVAACRVLSGGHPGVLSRLVDEVARGGLSPDDTSVGRLHEVGKDVVRSAVLGRLAGQPDHVVRIARAVAVLGSTDVDLVCALSGTPVRAVLAGIEFLRESDLLPHEPGDPDYEPVREALLHAEPHGTLSRMRMRAARLLNDAGSAAETVAELLLPLPGRPQPWMRTVLQDAANEAGRRGAPKLALRYLCPLLDDTPDDIRLRHQVALLFTKNDPLKAVRHLRVALDKATDPRIRAAVAVQFGLSSLAVHRSAEAVDVLADALRELDAAIGDGLDPADRELRISVVATTALVGSDTTATMERTMRLLDRTREPAGNTPAERQLLAMMAIKGLAESRPVEEVVAAARQSLQLDDPGLDGWSVLAPAMALAVADEVQESLSALDRVLESCHEDGAVWTSCQALGMRASVLYGVGDFAESAADAQRALETAAREGLHPDSTRSSVVAFAAALAQLGEQDRGLALLDSVTGSWVHDSPWENQNYLMASAGVRAERGDVDEALSCLYECGASLTAAGITNPLFVPWWSEAVWLLVNTGRVAQAVPLAELGEDLARRWEVPSAKGLALTARAMVTEGRGRVGLLTEAVRVLDDSPARFARQRAEFLLGRELLERGDTKAAREHLRTSVDLATRCAARTAATAGRELLVMAGGRMRQAATGARTDALTRTERQVAELAAAGATNREIAEALFVIPRTIEFHLTNVYRKLGVTGRRELTRALAAGALPAPGDWPDTQR